MLWVRKFISLYLTLVFAYFSSALLAHLAEPDPTELFRHYDARNDVQRLRDAAPEAVAEAVFLQNLPRDPWGRQYQMVVKNEVLKEFYSLGPDGITATNGNDADDVNSWNSESGSGPWRARQQWIKRVRPRMTLLLFPAVAWLLWKLLRKVGVLSAFGP